MGWSTRQLADLAGTTVRTIRHYHAIGLLDEPERTPNGYKQYRVPDLVRLLRIRRLTDLGMPLQDIADADDKAFHRLDEALAANIERLRRRRAELAAILRDPRAADLPPGLERVPAALPDAERGLLLLYSRLCVPAGPAGLARLLAEPPDPVTGEFSALAADASEQTRQSLAERYLPVVRRQHRKYTSLTKATERMLRQNPRAAAAVVEGLRMAYNEAQLDVLRRVNALLTAVAPRG
jgi:DNA-binding transcriptional MerR regulator